MTDNESGYDVLIEFVTDADNYNGLKVSAKLFGNIVDETKVNRCFEPDVLHQQLARISYDLAIAEDWAKRMTLYWKISKPLQKYYDDIFSHGEFT